jgi:hypothetical protein
VGERIDHGSVEVVGGGWRRQAADIELSLRHARREDDR